MVLIDRSDLPQVWTTVKKAAHDNADTPTVLLLCSHSTDSIAAVSLLTKLLQDEGVPHKVVPVADYADLSRVYVRQIASATELRSIFLINCGGIVDLMGHFQATLDEEFSDGIGGDKEGRLRRATELPHPECRWYILDSHRPYALENLYYDANEEEPPNVYVVHDGETHAELEDILAQLPILFDASDGEESEDEEEPERRQRPRVTLGEYHGMSPDSQRDRRRILKRLTRRYYAASWHGTAASLLCYSLVQALNKGSNELLWLAILGLTDQLVHERIEHEKYVEEAQLLQAEVGAFNQDGATEERREVVPEEGGPSVSVRQHITSRMRLANVQELRLSLMRHWTVYEALHHSPYIASRLGLYQQAGRDKLDVFLARMGIPLEECQQEYNYMRKQYKADALYEKMLHYGNEFGLVNLTYPSFRSITGYGHTQIAAADLVSAVTAVLEHFDASTPDGAGAGAFAAAQSALTTGLRVGLETALREGAMKRGLDRAKELLRATVAVGHSVLTAKEYTNFGDFHSVALKAGGDTAHFLHPLALTKLALFVADALREGTPSLRNGSAKPLLMSAPNPEESPPTYLIVAVLGSARCWRAGGKNSFGSAFARAAEKTNAHMAHDGFDSAVCKVAAADHERFHEHIVLELERTD